ncbi:NHS-like protein 1 isoform X3 [Myxocyprinus asiaticus]|uniref:NHS-like protein 1 isoform X3 n=1 Tax=Myxocyprinus asiaticus TaxID=70543 RepID=UPI0022218824|nr:NHS-like protein 1 isoform X3 [Myxocyprinus asiaticus]
MPFPERTVEPQLVSRLRVSGGSEKTFITPDGRRIRKPILLASLEEVCCHTLTGILHQLSDISRHASNIFLEIETQAGLISKRTSRIQVRLERLQVIACKFDPKQIKIPVSNLDEEKKWTVHYTAPWHQQENVFLPGSRPACVEDLHRQAKVNLKTALRECDKLRKDGFRSSQYYSQGPSFTGPTQTQHEEEDSEVDDADKKSIASSGEEEKDSYQMREQSPAQGEGAEVDGQGPRTKAPPLPTPEEKMRQEAQAILTDIIPINVTGETFDRQASIRRSLINTDTLTHRPKKVKRRKTISGVPDSVQRELAAKGRGGELRPQSMFIPGQYSTLGRVVSGNSTLRRSETKDSGCQTEEVKIVPPSVRRIRAQKGQGIAAQMAGISTSATSISAVSDGSSLGSSIIGMAPNFSNDSQRFHSLPRGARVSLNAEPLYSSTPFRKEDSTAKALQPIGKLQVDDTVVHMRCAPRACTLTRPKSQEVRGTQREWGSVSGPACVVSPHAAYSTSLIPNATLSCSTEVIALHTTSSSGQSLIGGSPYPKARPHSMISTVNSESTSSVATGSHTPEAGIKDTCSETGRSDSSLHSHSTIAAGTMSSDEQWIYDTPENVLPKRTLTSSCSTPINHLYNSLERSSKGTDSSSLYSMDNDGYYTSMHLDSGLRSRSQGSGHGHGIGGRASRHSMYECLGQQEDQSSLYSSLSRSISLRKPKKPPLPPARTDSLRRKPKKTNSPNVDTGGSVLNESLIATLQQSLQNGLKVKGLSTSPSHSPCSDYEDPWMLRPRSQSSISAGSSGISATGMANVYAICHVTPSHSDTSSLRSDYADSWGYYMDYPRPSGDQTQSPCNNALSAGQAVEITNGRGFHSGTQTTLLPPQEGSDVSVKARTGTSSPDRVHRLTSPSSGYSSQSNTPTAGTPVPSFMRCMSPSGSKPKPRVPERKSSLISSVSISSSSTSLSSNTSDSIRNNVPLPPPLQADPVAHLPFNPPSYPPPLPPSSPVCNANEIFPPPPVLPMSPHQQASMYTPYIKSSPEFPPPPPPEVLIDPALSSLNSSFSPPPPPLPPLPACSTIPLYPPPQFPVLSSMTPPAPSSASLKKIKGSLKPVNSERWPVSTQSEEPNKSGMPLITPFALQSVQLRSVKQPENSEFICSKSQEIVADQMTSKPQTPEKPKKQEHSSVPLVSCIPLNINGESNVEAQHDCDVTSVEKLHSEPKSCLTNGSIDFDDSKATAEVDGQETDMSPPVETLQNTTPKKKPPMISKKPKVSLAFSSFSTPECKAEENSTASTDKDVGDLLSAQNMVVINTTTKENQDTTPVPEEEIENNKSEISVPPEEIADIFPTSGEAQEFSQTVLDMGMGTSEGDGEEYGGDDENVTSSTGSVGSKDDESGEVFESSTSQGPGINGDSCKEMVTPTRPRTTEDLFATIHRSKRKVLGRRESEEDRSQGPLSPVTPTGIVPGLTSSLPRQSGSIQRSLRKSATSSDTFKALLLKKGSRSETSFRMSAAEMLRTTDPRFQRTRSLDSSFDPASPTTQNAHSPFASPNHSKRAPEDWARNEGLMRCSPGSPFSTSPSITGPRYGRSRTPPSAASSKYNARSRILSSPMTVICEREGELTESGEHCEEPTIPLPISQDSNSTLCEQSSS